MTYTILVVDDHSENRYMLQSLLSASGYTVRLANNGSEALSTLLTEVPDLILSDILMPVMDGYQLCREIRQRAQLKDLPFVFYTATYTEPKDEAFAMSLGADLFLVKPMEPEVLLDHLQNVLENRPISTRSNHQTLTNPVIFEQRHNRILFDKLQQKITELEAMNQRLTCEIQERRTIEEALNRMRRMDELALLTSGVAHDFNNILVGIMSYCDLAFETLEADHPARSFIQSALKATQHATQLTRTLLDFSRKHKPHMAQYDLNVIISDFTDFLSHLITADIQLQFQLHATPLLIWADKAQIEQVMMNLVVNARNALPHGGVITLRSGIGSPAGDAHAGDAPAGNAKDSAEWAYLSVADNGTGMAPAVMQHLFEPFFTTKEEGLGTGLGLSLIKGITDEHQGRIAVESEPGKGTCVTIFVPLQPSKTSS